MEILVVEDDTAIRRAVAQGLFEAGHECVQAANGEKALLIVAERQPDVIVLDVMLAGTDGFAVLQQIRERGHLMPVVMLTALGSVEDRVRGLSLGADDYLIKPFAFQELLARIEAVHRRTQKPASQLAYKDLSLDLATRCVYRDDERIELTPTEFTLLEMLMRHAGQVVSRQMLCQQVWGFTWTGNMNVIEVHINRLRQKVERPELEPLIQTLRGRGYAIR